MALNEMDYTAINRFIADAKTKSKSGENFSPYKLAKEYQIPYVGIFPLVLQKRGIFKKVSRGKYIVTFEGNLSRAEIENMIIQCQTILALYKKGNKLDTKIKIDARIKQPNTLVDLSSINDNILLEELKKRGYAGNLSKRILIKVG